MNSKKRLKDEIVFRFVNPGKMKRLSLAFAALILLYATSSELWFGDIEPFFDLLAPFPVLLIFPILLYFVLFLLYYYDWNQVTFKEMPYVGIFFGLISATIDCILMYSIVFSVYWFLGNPIGLIISPWKLLYLAIPLAIGEFSLSSIISQERRKAKELQKRLEESMKEVDSLVQTLKEIEKGSSIPPRISDARLEKYLEEIGEESGESIDEQRE